jgi:hypothetical protein
LRKNKAERSGKEEKRESQVIIRMEIRKEFSIMLTWSQRRGIGVGGLWRRPVTFPGFPIFGNKVGDFQGTIVTVTICRKFCLMPKGISLESDISRKRTSQSSPGNNRRGWNASLPRI